MRVLLDTNAYSLLLRGDIGLASRVRRAHRVLMSVIVVGELLYGFRVGSRHNANSRLLDEFLESPRVELLPVTLVTADRFGRIAAALREKGRPVPANDIWIAAHAMEAGADLLSADRHFEHIDGVAWVDISV